MDDVIEEILNLEAEMEADRYSMSEQACARTSQRSYSQPDCLALPSSLQHLTWGPLKPYSSCPPDLSIGLGGDVSELASSVQMRERRRKESHNMFERRRRSTINERIKELATLLPHKSEPHYELVRDLRHSTGQILKAAVDYIKKLKLEMGRRSEAEARRHALELENRRLRSRVEQLEAKLQELGVNVDEGGACSSAKLLSSSN